MPVSIIVGGQFGSEGKGKVALYFVERENAAIAVRVGGSNSGHTVVDAAGALHVFRQLPTATIVPGVALVMAAGSYLDVDVLLDEIERHKVGDRVWIDPLAMVVRPEHGEEERRLRLQERIGSTQSGTGAAVVERIGRSEGVRLAKDDPRLRPYVRPNLKERLYQSLRRKQRIVVEGTQGFGLSLLHTPYYPNATSRDTTAAGFLSEVGLSPLDVDQVVLVLRAFPIRVAGNSGPLEREMTWDEIQKLSGAPFPLKELTTVTRKVRRVAAFTPGVVVQAIRANNPSHIVMNHIDHVDSACTCGSAPTEKAKNFIADVEAQIGRKIDLIGVGRRDLYPSVTRPKLAARGEADAVELPR